MAAAAAAVTSGVERLLDTPPAPGRGEGRGERSEGGREGGRGGGREGRGSEGGGGREGGVCCLCTLNTGYNTIIIMIVFLHQHVCVRQQSVYVRHT